MSYQPGRDGRYPNGCFTRTTSDGSLEYAAGSYEGYSKAAYKATESHAIDIVTNSKVSSEEKTQIAKNIELFELIINHKCWGRDTRNIQAIVAMRRYIADLKAGKREVWSDPTLTNITTLLIQMRDYLSNYKSKSLLGISNYSDRMNAFQRAINKSDFGQVIEALKNEAHIDDDLKTDIISKIESSDNTLEEYRIDKHGVAASL